MKILAMTILGSLVLLVAGCPQGVDCTLEARVSVSVTVTDADGEPVPEVGVTYEANGGAPETCEEHGGAYLCGHEVEGDLLIRVQAEGYQDHAETVTVTADECHVLTEHLEVILQPLDCTDEEIPSVIAYVVDAAGDDIPDAAVEYVPQDELWTAPEPCEPLAQGGFVCGYEYDGFIDLWAEAPGFESGYAAVEVGADECHVITEEYTFVLDPDD